MGEDTMTMTEEQMAQEAANAAMMETEEASSAQTQASVPGEAVAEKVVSASETASQTVNPMTQQTQQMLSQVDGSTSAQAETHVPEASSGNKVESMGFMAAEATLLGTIAGKISGNKLVGTLVGVGGSLIGQKIGWLPDSLEDVKNLISKAGEWLTQKTGKDFTVGEVENSEQTDSDLLKQMQESVQADTGAVVEGVGVDGISDITEQMTANGASMAETGALNVAAGMNQESLNALQTLSAENMNLLQTQVTGLLDENGELPEEMKADVAGELKALYDGYAAYGAGAEAKLAELYGTDSETYQEGMTGLAMVMQAEAGPLYATMQQLDEQYGLFTEEDMTYFAEHPITGMNAYGSETTAEAGLEQSGTEVQAPTAEAQTQAEPAQESEAGVDRGAEAEAKFGSIVDGTESAAADYQME